MFDFDPVIDVGFADWGPRLWCSECRRITLHGRDIDGYPLCKPCETGEEDE
jgi:hypothetical protein